MGAQAKTIMSYGKLAYFFHSCMLLYGNRLPAQFGVVRFDLNSYFTSTLVEVACLLASAMAGHMMPNTTVLQWLMSSNNMQIIFNGS